MVFFEWRLRQGVCAMCKVAGEMGKEYKDGKYVTKEKDQSNDN